MPNNVIIIGPQPEEEVDELREEQQLLESCQSRANLAMSKTLTSIFKASSLELGPAEELATTTNKQRQQLAPEVGVDGDEPHWQVRNTIRAKLPSYQKQILWITGNSKLGRAIIGNRVSKLLYALTIGSLTLWLIAGACLLFKHDALLKRLHQTKTKQSTLPQTDRCTLKENLIYLEGSQRSDDYQEFLGISDWLAYLGIPLTELTGIGVTLGGIICLLPVAFHYFSYIFLKFKHLQVDHISFLLNPIGERSRIRAEIDSIIEGLIYTIHHHKSGSSKPFKAIKLHRVTKHRIEAMKGSLRSRAQKFCFAKILIEIYNLNLVQPVIVTSGWHRQLSRIYRFMLTFSSVCNISSPLVADYVLILVDIYTKVNHRLGTIECHKWNPNGVLIEDFTLLEQLQSEQEQEAFRLHDGSTRSLIYLVWIEARYYFTCRVVIYILAKVIFVLASSLWSACFVIMYFIGHIDRIVWLNQLEEQIGLSIKNAMEQAELIKSSGHDGEKSMKLAKQLTITYINYELFRRQQRNFQKLSNFLISQGFVFCSGAFIICYFVAKNIDNKFMYPTICSQIAVIALMNLYLIMSSYMCKKVEKIAKGIFRLVNYASDCWPAESEVQFIEMWRRQLLPDHEAHQLFTSSLLGSPVSYQRLLYFNTQVMATWILIFRLKF